MCARVHKTTTHDHRSRRLTQSIVDDDDSAVQSPTQQTVEQTAGRLHENYQTANTNTRTHTATEAMNSRRHQRRERECHALTYVYMTRVATRTNARMAYHLIVNSPRRNAG